MEARYYQTGTDKTVHCHLCPHLCKIADGMSGACGIRENRNGTLVAAAYGEVTSTAMDPIEKKPLYHFHPGAQVFSVGSYGCNFLCRFCQNYSISQGKTISKHVDPRDLVRMAMDHRSAGIAYTYNEPLINYEFVNDCCRLAREEGLWNVLVTNGHINRKPFEDLLPVVDAANIDLKSIRPEFYQKLCSGKLEAVQSSIALAVQRST